MKSSIFTKGDNLTDKIYSFNNRYLIEFLKKEVNLILDRETIHIQISVKYLNFSCQNNVIFKNGKNNKH